jgi:hypothetical protein
MGLGAATSPRLINSGSRPPEFSSPNHRTRDIRDARVLAGNARLNRHQTVVSPAAHLGAFASP